MTLYAYRITFENQDGDDGNATIVAKTPDAALGLFRKTRPTEKVDGLYVISTDSVEIAEREPNPAVDKLIESVEHVVGRARTARSGTDGLDDLFNAIADMHQDLIAAWRARATVVTEGEL